MKELTKKLDANANVKEKDDSRTTSKEALQVMKAKDIV